MSEDLLKIAEGFSLIAEGVRSLAERKPVCGCGQKEDVAPKNKPSSGKKEPEEKTEPKAVTIEQVRAVMAAKSQDGKTQQVKALLKKYGADKLSGVQPEQYADLLKDAEAL